MKSRLFAALDREWETLCTSRAARHALSRWSDDHALRGFAGLDGLIETLRHGRHDPERADQILVALARRAPGDAFAARTLLQAILPGVFNVAKRIGHGDVDDDLEAEVLTEAVHRIRTYPIDRRPRTVAANITWDVFGAITRRRRRRRLEPAPELVEPIAEDDPSREVCDLVGDALDAGLLRKTDARLLLAIAVGHDTIRRRAEREGISYDAMNVRWRRARNRLRVSAVA